MAPVEQVSMDIDEIAKIDTGSKVKHTIFKILQILTLVALAVLYFSRDNPDWRRIWPEGLAICGVLVICFWLLKALYGYIYFNIPNHRYWTLSKVLPLLGQDLDANTNVDVKLILSRATQKKKCLDKLRWGWSIARFRDDWLLVQGQFIDGTEFGLTAADLVVVKRIRKRSRSGKIKRKRKEKMKAVELSLSLTFPRRKYGAISVLRNDAVDAIQLPEWVEIQSFRVKNNSLYLKVKTLKALYKTSTLKWSAKSLYKTITMMFLSLYHILNLARVLSQTNDEVIYSQETPNPPKPPSKKGNLGHVPPLRKG